MVNNAICLRINIQVEKNENVYVFGKLKLK